MKKWLLHFCRAFFLCGRKFAVSGENLTCLIHITHAMRSGGEALPCKPVSCNGWRTPMDHIGFFRRGRERFPIRNRIPCICNTAVAEGELSAPR